MTSEQVALSTAPGGLGIGLGRTAGGEVGSGERGVSALGTRAAFALAAFSGLAYAASFPPLAWPPAAWVALVPLLVACAALSPARAALAGMCWTAALGAGVAWFLPDMLSRYFALGAVQSWLGAGAVGALNGIYVSAYAAWVSCLARRRAANPLLLAGGWLVCEFGRAHGVLGSQWALAAYSQVSCAPLIQIADLAGPYGIGMLIAAVNAGIAALAAPALRGRRPRLAATAIAAAVAAVVLYGQWRLGQSFADGAEVSVAIVQAGAPPLEPSQKGARLARYAELTESTAAPADLVIWPEYAVEAYLEEPSPARAAVLGLSRRTHADLILGGPHYTPSPAGTRYHNSAYVVGGGRLAGRYDKHRLVPFAEEDRLAWLLGARPTSYSPGTGPAILAASGIRIGASLCLETMFPEVVRQSARDGAEVLVNLSNDAWFGHAAPARHQLEIAALRAVESRRFLLRAAATGFSAVVDPHGRIAAQSELDADQVLVATVRASHAHSPYERWGDAFAWAVIAAVAGATLRPLLDRAQYRIKRRSS